MQTKRYPFSKKQRLLKPEEYQAVFKQQKKKYYAGLLVYYGDNAGPQARLGIAVPKRHFKRAVARNRLKRQIRESFRMQQQKLGNKDIIVVATAKLAEEQPCQTTRALEQIWQQLAAPSSSTP